MDVLINPYNMGHLEGIQDTLQGASIKYVVDLIFDSIVFRWGLKIPHSHKSTNKRKYRLSDRHIEHVANYANNRHISNTIAANLILNDYFSSQLCEKNADVAKISPTTTTIKTTEQKPVSTDNPKPLRGAALLQNLKG